jgi:hypothetical protein
MAKLERWGKKYNNKRNWPEYNKQLVRYGTLSLSLEFVEQWDQYSSNFSSVNLGKSSIPTNFNQPRFRRTVTNVMNLSFFRVLSQTKRRKRSKRNKYSSTVLSPLPINLHYHVLMSGLPFYEAHTRMKLNATRDITSKTHACLTPAASDDSPICPAISPEKSASIRHAW